MCATCADKGIVRLNWADAPEDYAVCLCDAGLALRRDENWGHKVAPLWVAWAARERVPLERVVMVEDVLSADELRERGLVKPVVEISREAALLAAGKQIST